jgi:hypothetical protein
LADLVLVRIQAPQLIDSVRLAREHMFVPAYTENELRVAVAGATSMSEVLRRFGLRPAGGNHRHLRKWLDAWQIPEELLAEVAATSWSAVGRRYGVSDNAVRKWVRAYEAERRGAGSGG